MRRKPRLERVREFLNQMPVAEIVHPGGIRAVAYLCDCSNGKRGLSDCEDCDHLNAKEGTGPRVTWRMKAR